MKGGGLRKRKEVRGGKEKRRKGEKEGIEVGS